MNATQISYVALWSKDLDANRAIFANILGIPIAYEDENVVVFQTEGAQLVLQRAIDADADLDGTIQFGISVDNLDQVTEALKANHLTIEIDREEITQNQRVTIVRLGSGQAVEFTGE
ncbi:MAG: VOC family protein [Anaerolineae bacterium]|nr:VOC family protein [Thermoflexales bacterium]MDW8406981.1 VOC family protein [Anaerolineae bacterium]